MKIRSMGADLFHADGRTDERTDRQIDMTNLIVVFRNFVKALKTTCNSDMTVRTFSSCVGYKWQFGLDVSCLSLANNNENLSLEVTLKFER
jgi:hypothetical protein